MSKLLKFISASFFGYCQCIVITGGLYAGIFALDFAYDHTPYIFWIVVLVYFILAMAGASYKVYGGVHEDN